MVRLHNSKKYNMKKTFIILLAVLITIHATGQKKNLAVPAATLGGDWFVTRGAGDNSSAKLRTYKSATQQGCYKKQKPGS